MPDYAALREAMVERQIARRGIADRRILDAFLAVPREQFVPETLRELAYEDGPLPIGADQTISQPYIVALMIDAAGLAPGDRVLEVGGGSGYAAAVMAEIAAEVVSIERHRELADAARERLARLGYDHVRIVQGDGSEGLAHDGPFDAILVAAAGPQVPRALLDQLSSPGGALVMPVGDRDGAQKLVKVTRTGGERFVEEDLGAVRFVPLIGAAGWSEGSVGMSVAQAVARAVTPLPGPERAGEDQTTPSGSERAAAPGPAVPPSPDRC